MPKLSQHRKLQFIQLFSLLAAGLLFVSAANAAPYSVTRYVKIDHQDRSAYVYDDDFTVLTANPYVPKTSIEVLPDNEIIWYLGAKIDVVRKNPDSSIDVLSADPSYYEMNHHLVWVYQSANKRVTDDCGFNRPLAAGSELTDMRWPSGYGYKMQGGVIFPSAWHWENPANVSTQEDVYIRFIMQLDNSPTGYKDTHVTWIDTVPCTSAFPVPSGKVEIEGPDYPVIEKSRLVSLMPHLHDHSKKIEFKLNGEKLRVFTAENAAIPVAHDDMGDGPVLLHTHAQHLPTEGLTTWSPGAHGPIMMPGDILNVRSEFRNPHAETIDNMALGILIWESLSE
ncbi:MAG: hypothetical protein ACC707_20990 [Thiohalomonadales bacterium]